MSDRYRAPRLIHRDGAETDLCEGQAIAAWYALAWKAKGVRVACEDGSSELGKGASQLCSRFRSDYKIKSDAESFKNNRY